MRVNLVKHSSLSIYPIKHSSVRRVNPVKHPSVGVNPVKHSFLHVNPVKHPSVGINPVKHPYVVDRPATNTEYQSISWRSACSHAVSRLLPTRCGKKRLMYSNAMCNMHSKRKTHSRRNMHSKRSMDSNRNMHSK